jgi:hypothetical protein
MQPHPIQNPQPVNDGAMWVWNLSLRDLLAQIEAAAFDRVQFEHNYQEWLLTVGWRTRRQTSS